MPFTFAHPAIVVPLKQVGRRWFSLTGLIAGSVAPDFEYFIRLEARSTFSHTLYGIVVFNLPMAFLLAMLFHGILRRSLISHLPTALYRRTAHYRSFRWMAYLQQNSWIVISSICIGSFSHIFWDAFTHEKGYFVELWPALKTTIGPVFGYSVHLYRVMQHGSTVAGLAILAAYFFSLPHQTDRSKPLREILSFWGQCAIVTALLFVVKLIVVGPGSGTLVSVVVTLISCGILALIVTSLMTSISKKKSRRYR